MKKIVVLTGSGISAESGIPTFRGTDGLWEGHRVEEVATPDAFEQDPELVLKFYNNRRRKCRQVMPNAGHLALKKLEEKYAVTVITQNVDNLHERAGSTHVMHLHGELMKARSSTDQSLVYDCDNDILLGDKCANGSQLRPHIVWFGEMVPMIEHAANETMQADILLIVGTSMVVYPAAGLVDYAPEGTPIYLVDPNPPEMRKRNGLIVIAESASKGLPALVAKLLAKA